MKDYFRILALMTGDLTAQVVHKRPYVCTFLKVQSELHAF